MLSTPNDIFQFFKNVYTILPGMNRQFPFVCGRYPRHPGQVCPHQPGDRVPDTGFAGGKTDRGTDLHRRPGCLLRHGPQCPASGHPHFYCTQFGRMNCLTPETVNIDFQAFKSIFPGLIDKFEMRLDGICRTCLKKE